MATNGQTDVLEKSVTRQDYNDGPVSGGVMHFMLPSIGASPDLPGFWSYARDWVLYSTIYRESMWAAAVYLAVTKQASKSWEVESDIPKRQKDAQQLFLHFDTNKGYVSGISKHLQAYILTGNGGPVEIVRATGAPGAKVLGLIPLDPFRTIRTGDADIPYIYTDRRGALHELRDYDAFCITDQPDVSDLWFGVGHCSAERAYAAIRKLEAIERYIYEKVSGNRALALDFVSGVTPKQIQQAQDTAKDESAAKGVFTYLGSTIIAMAGDQAPQHVRINLAELPDGFQRKEEFDIAVLTYARSLGIPVQDLQPLSGQGLGTGAQTQVLEESAKGQGMATWAKNFGHFVNEFALDDKTTFYFRENDIRDREREAKLRIDEATAIATWVQMQSITIEQARQLGVDRDQLPQEFIEQDNTPGDALSDSEKPADEEAVTPETTEMPVLETEEPVLSDPILKSAREIYQRITTGASDGSLQQVLDQQSKLIELLAARKEVQPDLSESVRQSVDMAYRAMNENAIQVNALAQAIGDTHKSIERDIETRASASDVSSLRTTLDKLIAQQKERVSEIAQLQRNLNTLASKEPTVIVKTDHKLIESAVNDAVSLASVSLKHAEDLEARVEIVERDRNGLASMAEKTLISGDKLRYRIVRGGDGRIQRLDKV